jgi:hypothetical protein
VINMTYAVGERVEVQSAEGAFAGWCAATVVEPDVYSRSLVRVRFDVTPELSPAFGTHGDRCWYATPGEVRAATTSTQAASESASPTPAPTHAARGNVVSPGPRPNPGCEGKSRRGRGEVRAHFWACGCAVVPESAEYVDIEGGNRPDHVSDGSGAIMRDSAGRPRVVPQWFNEYGWHVGGFGVWADAPTREAATGLWREALALTQRAEDERASGPRTVLLPPSPYHAAGMRIGWTDESGAHVATLSGSGCYPRADAVTGFYETQEKFTSALDAVVRAECLRLASLREEDAIKRLPEASDGAICEACLAVTPTTALSSLVALANECGRRWPEATRMAASKPERWDAYPCPWPLRWATRVGDERAMLVGTGSDTLIDVLREVAQASEAAPGGATATSSRTKESA